MNLRDVYRLSLVAALAVGAAVWSVNRAPAAQGPANAEEGVEVLTRGPVHEAFAAIVTFDPEPGLVAPRKPPDLIEELPPEQQPEGDNVEWIPGYWAWDDEREDFMWISGLWRALPPGREWVPGYWSASGPGAQWTSGYWADAGITEREYFPEPPATAEMGPNIAQPSPDHNWIPGCWVWQENRYAWRPGYWAVGHQNWDWIPSHYQWTRRGYLYIDGYYDYSVDRRGVLFSPVYLRPSIYGQRGFSYSPRVTINLAGFTNHLFLRPNYQHYYFGDYYGSGYTDAGFLPWFTYGSRGRGYDPFFARQQWRHRDDSNWTQRIKAEFNNRRDHEEARPPRTWRAQQELITSGRAQDRDRVVVRPYDELVKSESSWTRFHAVDQAQRQSLSQRSRDIEKFRLERQKLETDAADSAADRSVRERQPARVRLPRSPIVGRPGDQLDKDPALPRRPDTPPPDPRVEPKPRRVDRNPVPPQAQSGERVRRPPGASKDRPTGPPQAQPGSKPRGDVPDRKRAAPPAGDPDAKATPPGKSAGKRRDESGRKSPETRDRRERAAEGKSEQKGKKQ